MAASCDDDFERFERVAGWWDQAKPVLLDPVLVDRCEFGIDSSARPNDEIATNADALIAVSRHIGNSLVETRRLGARPVAHARLGPGDTGPATGPGPTPGPTGALHDSGLGIRLWITARGSSSD